MSLHDATHAMSAHRLSIAVALLCGCIVFAGCPEQASLGERVFVSGVTPGLQVASTFEKTLVIENAHSVPVLQIGDIVAGEEQGGYLRRVTGLRRQGVNIVAETEEARIEEAVETGFFAKDIIFTNEDFQDAGILPHDETLTLFQFEDLELFTAQGVTVSIDKMTLDVSPELYMAVYYSEHMLRRFSMRFDADLDLDVDFRIGVDEGTHVLAERDLLPPVNHPFVAHIGILPIAGNAQFRLVAGIEGNFEGDTSLRTGFAVATKFSAGGEFTRGEWERILGFSPPVFSVSKPVMNIEAGANVRFYIVLETEIRLFNAVEANLRVSPFLNTHVEAYPAPFVYILDGGFSASGACSARLFSWQIYDESFDYLSPYREFAYFSSNGE